MVGQPQSLPYGQREDAAIRAVSVVDDARKQRSAAQRLARHADALVAGAGDQRLPVGVKGVEVHARERRVELAAGMLQALVVGRVAAGMAGFGVCVSERFRHRRALEHAEDGEEF